MIAGNQLAKRRVEQTLPSLSASNALRIAWQEVRFPVRIIEKLYAALETWVPVGYEDETGFHYSMKASDWVFSI
jgi:hypothetical protein